MQVPKDVIWTRHYITIRNVKNANKDNVCICYMILLPVFFSHILITKVLGL